MQFWCSDGRELKTHEIVYAQAPVKTIAHNKDLSAQTLKCLYVMVNMGVSNTSHAETCYRL